MSPLHSSHFTRQYEVVRSYICGLCFMYSVFPSPLITWHGPLHESLKYLLFLLPITTAFVQTLVSSLGHCSPPAGLHCIFQSHQSELENVGFDCAISLSRIAQFPLPPYTMKSKLKYGLLEHGDPLSCLHSAAGQRGSPPRLAVPAALRSLASCLVDIMLLQFLLGRG